MIHYVVWRENGSPPTKTHLHLSDAIIEANRLAEANSNVKFFVYELSEVGYSQATVSRFTHTRIPNGTSK